MPVEIIDPMKLSWFPRTDGIDSGRKGYFALPTGSNRMARCPEKVPHKRVRVSDKKWTIIASQRLVLTFSVESKFLTLSKLWREEIGGSSSLSQITSNRYYLRIIAMGPKVIPHILADLQKGASPWFVALRALSEREDIGAEHAGNFRKIADAWIAWGKHEGHL